VHVLAERREAFRDGNEAALEPDDVREHECGDAEDGVGHDVERDEQAGVPSYHRAPCGAWEVWSMSASISDAKRLRPNVSACARAIAGSKGSVCTARRASAKASGRSSRTSTPVTRSSTVSLTPPRPRATTGRPQAWASTGTIPKSSSPGSIT